jgi:hypothetical protein
VAALVYDEGGDQRRGDREPSQRPARGPAPAVGLDQREHERDRPERDCHRPVGVVPALRGLLRAALRDDPLSQRQHEGADQHVNEEDPAPAQHLDDHPAEQQPHGPAGSRDRAPDREGAVALRPLGKGREDDRQRRGRDQRAAQPLQTPSDQQHALGLRDPRRCEPPEKSAIPATKSSRRPSRSASRPPSSRNPPKISVWAFSTHKRFCSEKPRSPLMVGNATFTTVASSTTMNRATATSVRTAFGSTPEAGRGTRRAAAPRRAQVRWEISR